VLLTIAVLLLAAVVTVLAYFLGAEEEAIPRAGGLGFGTLLLVGGGAYLVIYTIRMRQLDVPGDELGDSEVVWAKSSGSMAHFRSGKPWMFWDSVGGRLFLTNDVLEFRANPAEPWAYKITIPLADIRRAAPCSILGFINGALRVERMDGSYEIFTFGAAFDVSREWAKAIMEFRNDLLETDDSAC